MRIDGQWHECDDGILRPVIRGEIQNFMGDWESTLFLVDTGADCTVFSAATLQVLGFTTTTSESKLGGVGGTAESVNLTTSIRLTCDGGPLVVFKGNYSAFTALESLDICILGRDILNLFAIVVDRSGQLVALIRDHHRYTISVSGRG